MFIWSMDKSTYQNRVRRGLRPTSTCSIAWRNLRYETGWNGNRKIILNRLNGSFKYHTLNAIMGPSGAGKTTLLNCLNGNRVKGLTPESEIYLNKDLRGGKVVSYFIEQHVERTIVGRMRVGQILRYAYRFKNGNEGDMEGHIRKTIDELLLDELVLHRNFEQCSGGEQKRVAIAQELMSLQKPTLLFVDEPTTGLDSNAAHLVMKCLRQLATNHRMAIITSIHVPSDDILTLFDKLYVLAKGGVCIYSGRPDQLRSHLETEKFNIFEDLPPIEVLIKIACNGITDSRRSTLANQTLSNEYRNVTHRLSNLDHYSSGVPNHRKSFHFSDLCLQIRRLLLILVVAQYKMFVTIPLLNWWYIGSMSSIFSSDMVKPSGCYPLVSSYDDDSNEEETTSNNNNTNTIITTRCINQIENNSLLQQNIYFLGMTMFYYVFIVCTLGTIQFSPLVRVFNNEHRNQWYSLGVFFWSVTIVGFIQIIFYTILYSLFLYLFSGQHSVDNFELNWIRIGYFLLFYLMLAIYSISVGQLIGTIFSEHFEISMIFTMLSVIVIVLMSGYMLDLEMTHNILIHLIKELLKYNSIFKAILYTVYGLDRCVPGTEYSLVMMNHHVESKDIPIYLFEIVVNVVGVRLFTLGYMYWRYNSWGRTTGGGGGGGKHEKDPGSRMLPIDRGTTLIKLDNDTGLNKISITKRRKSDEEIQFEQFSRGKILVAWRDLSLYGTSLWFEQTSLGHQDPLCEKAILKNLDGQFRFGTLNALMGTSGAGKTSLLKVLNGRDKTRLSAQSQFYLSKFTRIQTCFITQDVSGHLLPGLTASQMLVYASRLKNAQLRECGVDTSQIDHQQIALNLLDELDLSDTVDTPVEKCSGGERKRLALALELTALQMPNLICIDEPTSGLDSNSAEVVVACLRKLTQTHSITIVTSIHQPNTEVLLMFDQIYVLARGGVCIYSGPPTIILPHLRSCIPEIPLLDTTSPIETLIKLSCRPFPDLLNQQLMSTSHLHFIQTTISSGLLEQHTQPVTDGIQQNRRRFSLEDTWILCARYLSYLRGHLWREWIAYLVMYFGFATFMVNCFQPIVVIPSGCINLDDDFNNTCSKTEAKIEQENLLTYNLQFTAIVFGNFFVFVLIQSSLSFLRESVFFFNEHRNGWYSSGSFYLTKSLFDTVPIMLVILVYVRICDIYESTIPGIYRSLVLVMVLCTVAFQGLAHLINLVSFGNNLLILFLAINLFLLSTTLSNLYIPVVQLHYGYRLLANFSIIRYMIECFVLLQYGFGRCLPKQIQPLLYLFSLDDSDYYHNLQILLILIVLFRILALALLVHRSNPDQNRRHQIQQVSEQVGKLRPTNTIIPGIGSPNEFRLNLIRF